MHAVRASTALMITRCDRSTPESRHPERSGERAKETEGGHADVCMHVVGRMLHGMHGHGGPARQRARVVAHNPPPSGLWVTPGTEPHGRRMSRAGGPNGVRATVGCSSDVMGWSMSSEVLGWCQLRCAV